MSSNNPQNSQSQSQSQSNNGGSSPLFFPSSSNPPSDIDSPAPSTIGPGSAAGGRGGYGLQRSNRGAFSSQGGSSPLHYSSSALNSDARLSQPSDIRSDLTSDAARERFRRSNYQRGDLNSPDSSLPRRRYFADSQTLSSNGLPSDLTETGSTATGAEPVRVIWGTNVSIQECSNNFRNFVMLFKYKYRKIMDGQDDDITDADQELHYVNLLNEMRNVGSTNLNLDARNLLSYNSTKKLYYQLQNYPQEVIPIMDQTIKDCMISLATEHNQNFSVEDIETNIYKIRPFNIQTQRGMRELNPNDIDKLISVKGLVLRTTTIIPDMKVAFFRCNVCDHTMSVEIDRGVIQEPQTCPSCHETSPMSIVHNRSSFSDKQVIKLQETPDLVPDGQTPHSVSLCVYDELVDSCRAGDRIEVCGIFRSIPVRINSRQRAMKSLFKTYVDVVHVKKIDSKRLGVDVSTLDSENGQQQDNFAAVDDEMIAADAETNGAATVEQDINEQIQESVEEVRKITEQEIEQIKEVSQRRDVYEILARSIAPSVYELDDIKKGILLQLFGGSNKSFSKGGRYRGDINILLCGDPSTSKSQILKYVHKIAPRGIYTSGKGSSAVGLTAYVTRDTESRQLVLESGALVLSDGGVCCIDEFDKMSDSTRSVLHEVMEQQTISIAKAGIITTLNARTSILASANPIGSRYNPELPVTSNIDLPPPLLSRFDLVYLVLDKVDASTDRQLAAHLASMYLEDEPAHASKQEVLPVEFLTLYINYAKQHIKPKITPEAKDELVRAYVDMRKLGEDVRGSERRITATTRQLESMIRLAEAHAKMRLSHKVELDDVREAIRLIKSALKDYATDPVTGKIDMDLVQTGQSSAQRVMRDDLANEVVAIIQNAKNSYISYNDLVKRINEQSQIRVENVELSDILARLQLENRVVVTGEGSRRNVRYIGGV